MQKLMVTKDDSYNNKCSASATHRFEMKDTRLRWDKADLAQYYNSTYNLLQYIVKVRCEKTVGCSGI